MFVWVGLNWNIDVVKQNLLKVSIGGILVGKGLMWSIKRFKF